MIQEAHDEGSYLAMINLIILINTNLIGNGSDTSWSDEVCCYEEYAMTDDR